MEVPGDRIFHLSNIAQYNDLPYAVKKIHDMSMNKSQLTDDLMSVGKYILSEDKSDLRIKIVHVITFQYEGDTHWYVSPTDKVCLSYIEKAERVYLSRWDSPNLTINFTADECRAMNKEFFVCNGKKIENDYDVRKFFYDQIVQIPYSIDLIVAIDPLKVFCEDQVVPPWINYSPDRPSGWEQYGETYYTYANAEALIVEVNQYIEEVEKILTPGVFPFEIPIVPWIQSGNWVEPRYFTYSNEGCSTKSLTQIPGEVATMNEKLRAHKYVNRLRKTMRDYSKHYR